MASTVLGRRLGGELLLMREARGLRQGSAAEVLTASVSKVAKMERGLVPMREPDIRALCDLYGQRDGDFVSRLLALAQTDRERRRARGWWDGSHSVSLAEYIALEDVALRLRAWQTSLVPGLFQTADYVRALAVSDLSWDELDRIEHIVESRARRQQRLSGDHPLRVHAIVWEAALRQLVGGRDVMAAQLGHLVETARRENVTLQVLPYSAGGHPCIGGPFNILSFAEDDALDVVHMDGLHSTVWAESAEESAHYGTLFARMAQVSLSPSESEQYIEVLAKEMSD
ncbi:helix-turn-helix transcriptional regulator [Streptomyces sp. TS71-3]|uniref:helix-turn-helix domain-containing protein n=1 Tax=Streptomyces sp. TS71-3 TaxID=2733862 RepID=UPI0020174FA8|nr:helix-turn-helix transcriptional regulator [Streptomyces sp. TS71-3]